MGADDATKGRDAGVRRPANPPVLRPNLPAGRRKANTAENAVGLRTNPIADVPARGAFASFGMMDRHHRIPALPV